MAVVKTVVQSWAIAIAVGTLVMDNMMLAMAVRVAPGVTNKTLSMDSWALAVSRVL